MAPMMGPHEGMPVPLEGGNEFFFLVQSINQGVQILYVEMGSTHGEWNAYLLTAPLQHPSVIVSEAGPGPPSTQIGVFEDPTRVG